MFVHSSSVGSNLTYGYNYTKLMAHNNDSYDDTESLSRPHRLEVNRSESEPYPQRRGAGLHAISPVSERSSTSVVTASSKNSQENLASPTTSATNKSQTSLASSKPPEKLRSGPSSRRTVLIIAGFFVVGTIFVISGIIVLCTENHPAFQTAGGIFVAFGGLSFILCLFLQQKNLKKLMKDLEQDLYFLHISDNVLLRSFFSFEGNTRRDNPTA